MNSDNSAPSIKVDDLPYAELVSHIQAGHPRAEQAMVERFARGLKLMLNRKCSFDVADDVFQETWRIAIEKVRNGDLRQPDRLPAFIHQIARNQLVMHFRKQSNVQELAEEQDVVCSAKNPEQTHETNQTRANVRDIILQLDTPRDREILMRFYVQEEDKEEICKDLSLSSQHFNRVIYRAKMRMRTLLEKQSSY